MVNHPALLATLTDFATRLVDSYDVDDVLHDVSNYALDVLAVDGAGLTIGPDPAAGDMTFVTASDADTEYVERRQDALGEGVCYTAAEIGTCVLVDDLTASAQWPNFAPEALQVGFHAAAGVPMVAQGQLIGVLNLYRRAAGAWNDEDVDAATIIARVATGYLTNATRLKHAEELAQQLQQAFNSRVVIEQAKGVLSERLHLPPDAAFELLRAHARRNRTALRDVASQVCDGALDIAP